MNVGLRTGLLAVALAVPACEPDAAPKPSAPKAKTDTKANTKSEPETKADPKTKSEPETKADPKTQADPKADPEPEGPLWFLECEATKGGVVLLADFRPSGIERLVMANAEGQTHNWENPANLVLWSDLEEHVLAFQTGVRSDPYLQLWALPKGMTVTEDEAQFKAKVLAPRFDRSDMSEELQLTCTARRGEP